MNNLITPGFMTVVEAIRIFAYFTFVYRLYRWGRRGKKETFVSCTLECLGRRDVIQRYCLFDSVNPGLPGASSCFAATESFVICTLSWVGNLVRYIEIKQIGSLLRPSRAICLEWPAVLKYAVSVYPIPALPIVHSPNVPLTMCVPPRWPSG